MKITIVAPLDSKAKKIIEQYRFDYDRKLLKLFEPVLEIIPPVETYSNLKKLQQTLADIFQRVNRFKVKINGIDSFLPEQPRLFFNIEEDKKVYAIREQLYNLEVFQDQEQPDFISTIPFFQFGSIDEAEAIFELIEDRHYKYQFFIEQIYLVLINNNDEESWQIIESFSL